MDENTDGTRRGSFTLRGTTGSQNGRPRLELSEYSESYRRHVTLTSVRIPVITWTYSYKARI